MPAEKSVVETFKDNFKKTVTEMLLLNILDSGDSYISDLSAVIRECSGEKLCLSFPYAAIYRLLDNGYIVESRKHRADDGRKRQYYTITEDGRAYLKTIREAYREAVASVDRILAFTREPKAPAADASAKKNERAAVENTLEGLL